MTEREVFYDSVLKADLLISDYTLLSHPQEKEDILKLLRNYIDLINDSRVTLIFEKFCFAKEEDTVIVGGEKEIYTQILMDLLAELKAEVLEEINGG